MHGMWIGDRVSPSTERPARTSRKGCCWNSTEAIGYTLRLDPAHDARRVVRTTTVAPLDDRRRTSTACSVGGAMPGLGNRL